MYCFTSGSDSVDALGQMNISGNVTPAAWYKQILKASTGKPYLLAIALLSDIVYWYRPTEVRDEATGNVIGWKKRFAEDLLRKSYGDYAEFFGETKKTVKEAMDCLEGMGIIRREFRNLKFRDGGVANNVMYIALDAGRLHEITYPQEEPGEAGTGKRQQSQQNQIYPIPGGSSPRNGRDTPSETGGIIPPERERCSARNGKDVPAETEGTNSENTTGITAGNTPSYPIYPDMAGSPSAGTDEMEAYSALIRENIEYDALLREYPFDGRFFDEIVALMAETVSIKADSVRINGKDYPYQVVKSQLLKLDKGHIEYVKDCMEKNPSDIRNIRAYLLTALYNAPNTIDNYFKAWVNRDMHNPDYMK